MSALTKLQRELAEAEENVKVCNDMLSFAPDDADAKETKAFLEPQIADLKAQIEALQSTSASTDVPPPPPTDDAPPPPPASKYDMTKHPKFQSDSTQPPPSGDDVPQQTFNVKDVVMAKWSEDKQWYQATIISKTGSSSDPVYTVTFKGYGNTETKRKHEIRGVVDNSKKRKAESNTPSAPTQNAVSLPASPKPGAASNGGAVISAAPSVDPTLVQRREPSKVSDGPTRMAPEPKKLKGTRALDKAKNSWNDWQKTGPKKAPTSGSMPKKKDSQFRTPDLPGAKVGFTGSGKGMQKDQARAKWNYQGGGGDDD